MRTVAFINWKGGVGKTTISINTAYILSRMFQEARILFIDTDKQGNSSDWFEADPEKPGLASILVDGVPAAQAIQRTRYDNIDVIASGIDLLDANLSVLKETDRRQDNILLEALDSVRKEYAFCIIDNPPDSNISVLNGLRVADDVICVICPDPFSLKGVRQLQSELDALNLSHLMRGILVNRFHSLDTDVPRVLREQGYNMFPHLRGGKATEHWLSRTIQEHRSIYEICPTSGYARDLKRFVDAYLTLVEQQYADNNF